MYPTPSPNNYEVMANLVSVITPSTFPPPVPKLFRNKSQI